MFTLFDGRTFRSQVFWSKEIPNQLGSVWFVRFLLRYRLLATHGSLAMRLQPLECSIWKCWPRRNGSDGLRKVSNCKTFACCHLLPIHSTWCCLSRERSISDSQWFWILKSFLLPAHYPLGHAKHCYAPPGSPTQRTGCALKELGDHLQAFQQLQQPTPTEWNTGCKNPEKIGIAKILKLRNTASKRQMIRLLVKFLEELGPFIDSAFLWPHSNVQSGRRVAPLTAPRPKTILVERNRMVCLFEKILHHASAFHSTATPYLTLDSGILAHVMLTTAQGYMQGNCAESQFSHKCDP